MAAPSTAHPAPLLAPVYRSSRWATALIGSCAVIGVSQTKLRRSSLEDPSAKTHQRRSLSHSRARHEQPPGGSARGSHAPVDGAPTGLEPVTSLPLQSELRATDFSELVLGRPAGALSFELRRATWFGRDLTGSQGCGKHIAQYQTAPRNIDIKQQRSIRCEPRSRVSPMSFSRNRASYFPRPRLRSQTTGYLPSRSAADQGSGRRPIPGAAASRPRPAG